MRIAIGDLVTSSEVGRSLIDRSISQVAIRISIFAIHFWPVLFILSFGGGYAFAQDSENKGQVAPDLVGKWCYVNPANGGAGTQTGSCITLNDDGTYEFVLDNAGLAKVNSFFPGGVQERDYGTWSAKGNTIFYKSSANGEGSFQIQKINQPQNEGTPMILVSGQAFASATGHDPW